jgi:hypothetical protein
MILFRRFSIRLTIQSCKKYTMSRMTYMRLEKSSTYSHTWLGLNPQIATPLCHWFIFWFIYRSRLNKTFWKCVKLMIVWWFSVLNKLAWMSCAENDFLPNFEKCQIIICSFLRLSQKLPKILLEAVHNKIDAKKIFCENVTKRHAFQQGLLCDIFVQIHPN